jgi:hypothetical protein
MDTGAGLPCTTYPEAQPQDTAMSDHTLPLSPAVTAFKRAKVMQALIALVHIDPTIHVQGVASDVTGFLRGQEHHGMADIFRGLFAP